MSASLSTEGRVPGLKAFTLSDIPYPIRKRALRVALAAADRALKDESAGVAGLLARLAQPTAERDAITRAAEAPSDRVYWVSRKAWESVMGS